MAPFTQSKETPMSQSEHSQYVPTQEYATRAPVQRYDRRYFQLPFDDEDEEEVIFTGSNDFEDGDFACPGFFKNRDLKLVIQDVGFGEWRYEMRREAQEILPFLYLGPYMCLKNRDFLYKQQFTLLLSIRTGLPAQSRLIAGEKAANELGIEADSIDILNNQDLVSALPRIILRINDHISTPCMAGNSGSQQQRKVLVFCQSGNERAAAVVAAYLMVMFNLDAGSAVYAVQQRRFCINIETPLWDALTSFEAILAAKRDVEKTRRATVANSSSEGLPPAAAASKKRNLHDRDGDAVMGDDMDVDDNDVERKPLAPFQDR